MSARFGGRSYTTQFRQPTKLDGNIIPGIDHGPSDFPNGDWFPAAWLPVSNTDTNQGMGFMVREEERTGDFIVITPGKLVALTTENLALDGDYDSGPVGRIVPAGLRVSWGAAAGSDVILEYTAVDVAQRIQSLITGYPVTAADTFDRDEVETALKARGLITGTQTVVDFISAPIGYAQYSTYAWCGGDGLNPVGYRFHNYKRQHKIAIGCDYALRLPLVPAATQAEVAFPTIATLVSLTTHFSDGTARWLKGSTTTLQTLLPKYADFVGEDWVGLAIGTMNVADAPHLTAWDVKEDGASLASTLLKNKKASVADLTTAGDYAIDTQFGILFFYKSGGAAIPTGMVGGTGTDEVFFNVYTHDFAGTADLADVADYPSTLASISGNIRPGDYVVCDRMSNYRKYVPRSAETRVLAADPQPVGDANDVATVNAVLYADPALYDRPEDIVGQVLTLQRYPREIMQKVQTFYSNLPTGLADRMPGSATSGYTDSLTYSGGGQFEVIVNFMK